MSVNPSDFKSGGVWLPAKEATSNWLLIALHGSEGSAENFQGLDQQLNISKLNYLYLNGPIPSYTNYRWYTDSQNEALSYLDEVLNLTERNGFNKDRTFLLGFSQGAATLFPFIAQSDATYAGCIALSGRIEDLPSLLQSRPPKTEWLITHGTEDVHLSPEITRKQVEELQRVGWPIEYKEFKKAHAFDLNSEIPYVRDWILSRI